MSGESALRATPSVNIEEFERRLHATGSLGAAHDDPLAELARLLGAEEEPPPPPPPSKPVEAPVAVSAPQVQVQAPPQVQPRPQPQAEPEPVFEAPAPPPLRPALRVESSFGRVVNVDFGASHAPVPPPPEPPPLLVEPPPFLEP